MTFLSTTMPDPLPVSSTARSHIANQTFTHPRWRLSVTRSHRQAERSSCSRVCRSCLASCCAELGWRGCGGWTSGEKGAGSKVGRVCACVCVGGRAVWSIHVLYTRLPGRHGRQKSWHVLTSPYRTHCDDDKKKMTWNGMHQLFVNPWTRTRLTSFEYSSFNPVIWSTLGVLKIE